MSKEIMKRSLALGALMAFVITGSAFAEITLTADKPIGFIYNQAEGEAASGEKGELTWNLGSNKLHIYDTCVKNDGTKLNYAVWANGFNFSGSDGSTLLIKSTTDNPIQNGIGFKGNIDVDKLIIDVTGVGILAQTGDITVNAKVLKIDASEGMSSIDNKLEIKGVEELTIISDGLGIQTGGSGNIEIETKELNIEANGGNAIQALYGNGNISVTATEKAIIKGDIQTGGASGETSDKISLSMNTADSILEGKVITNSGTTSLNLNGGAAWKVTGVSTVSELSGNDANIVVSDVTDTQVTIKDDQTEQMTVSASADATGMTGNYATDLQAIANSVVENVKGEDGNVTENTQAAATTAAITGDAIYEEISSEVKVDATGKAEINASDINKVVDRGNVSANDMMAVGLMTWRAGTNDMNKRMGELRDSNGEHGVWVRMVRGEQEYQSVKNQYNQYQLGYDEKLSVDKRWTVGAAISYIDAKNSFSNGNGESTDKSLAIYGSKLNDDGSFIDLIAKYGRLENEFELYTGMKDAEYDTNAYSFSAEFGKRFKQGKGMWIEPQVELTYGKVSSVDYVSSRGVKIAQDSMESLIGRVGFRLGKDIKQGNVYARASYLYDFDGETSATLDNKATLEQDLGGGWWEVGVGANINLSDATYIYADVEKTFGGEVDTNWQWNLGVRYSF